MTLAHDQAARPIDATLEMDRLRDRIAKVAKATLPVLLVGETGSGKELFAETLHRKSDRASSAFVKVRCAALTETLLERELFGDESVVVGPHPTHAGLFAAANGGTLFLDEIGELSLRAQAKLLRVLEVGEITRVGSTAVERVDVRVVAASNRDLPALVAEGRFRADLYYRLKGVTLRVPPLRERRSEILPLANAFLLVCSRQTGRRPPRLSERAASALTAHAWPGNVRELRATIACALVTCGAAVLDVEHLDLGDEARCVRHRPTAQARGIDGSSSRVRRAGGTAGCRR